MPDQPVARPPRWREHGPAALLAVVAGLLALWARHRLFPALSWNRDEPVYLWHVEVLRAGRLTATDGGFPELFQPWLSARGDGAVYTQYTLGWPLVLLAAALATGSAGSATVLGAALAVLGTYALGLELWRDRRVAIVGAALLAASPILPIQGGAYLSYLFTLGLGLLFGVSLLAGLRLRSTWRLVAAGVLLGWIFLTRPYDAVLWGAAFGGYAVVLHRARWRQLLRPLLVTGAAAVPFVVAALAYNRHVTGGWLTFPITAADPLDTFGFGDKRLMPTFEVVHYDLAKALRGTAKNAFFLPWFLVGSYAGLLAAGVGLWQRRREPTTLALVLVGAVFPVGYFVFWGNWLSSLAARISGPIYFVPLYAPICLLIASVLVRWWQDRRRLAVGLAVALVVGTVPAALSRFDVNRDISQAQAPWRSSVEGLTGRSLVFVADTAPYLLYLNPFSSNGPDLDDDVLYAVDGVPTMLDLIESMPDRAAYRQQATIPAQEVGPREDPYTPLVRLVPIEVRRGTTVTLLPRVAAPAGSAYVSLLVDTGADRHQLAVRSGAAELDEPVPLGAAPGALALGERGSIHVTVGWGDTPEQAAAPQVRVELQYRVVDGVAEVLVPSISRRHVLVDDHYEWRHEVGLPELQVEVAEPH